MDESAKRQLLDVARRSLEAAVTRSRPPECSSDDPELQGRQGCFVTLKNHGRLRGCLGCFTSSDPLWKTVATMAGQSATHDPRFLANPIAPRELAEIDVEISVLSPLERIADPLELKLGVHGVYIKRGFASGCFLPQVAEETGWSVEEFLSRCASGKAGLSPDAWRDPETEVYTFTVEIVSEKELGGRRDPP